MFRLQLKLVLLVCAVSSGLFAQDLHGDVEVAALLKVESKIFRIPDASTLQMTDDDKTQNSSAAAAEDQLVKQIYMLIEHFKQEDPVGLPLVPLPDPTVRILKIHFFSPLNDCVAFQGRSRCKPESLNGKLTDEKSETLGDLKVPHKVRVDGNQGNGCEMRDWFRCAGADGGLRVKHFHVEFEGCVVIFY